jgi:hypothetical protein
MIYNVALGNETVKKLQASEDRTSKCWKLIKIIHCCKFSSGMDN